MYHQMTHSYDGGMPPRDETMTARVLRLFRPERTSGGCLTATAGNIVGGYTQMRYHGERIYGHRAVLIEATGGDQPEMFACHTCDTRACVERAHLYWGTAQDNSDDRSERNGSFQTPTAKLDEARRLIEQGVSAREVARRLHVGRNTLAVHLGGKIAPSVAAVMSPKNPRRPKVDA